MASGAPDSRPAATAHPRLVKKALRVRNPNTKG